MKTLKVEVVYPMKPPPPVFWLGIHIGGVGQCLLAFERGQTFSQSGMDKRVGVASKR